MTNVKLAYRLRQGLTECARFAHQSTSHGPSYLSLDVQLFLYKACYQPPFQHQKVSVVQWLERIDLNQSGVGPRGEA